MLGFSSGDEKILVTKPSIAGFGMKRRPHSGLWGLLLAASWLGLVCSTRAHTLDTSYARVTISSNALEFKFTYDLATLLRITSLDANQDRQVSREELGRQAPEIYRYLRGHIYVELNSREARFGDELPPSWPDDALAAIPQEDYPQRLVSFTFRNPVQDTPEDVALIFDVFGQFGDRHTILGVFAHGGREHDVLFTRYEPDYLYDTFYRPTPYAQLGSYLKLGIAHIFLGYDHLLFLLALIVVSRFIELVKVVTAFTVAHTITLILAALQIVSLPARLIECGVALTIVYVAAENLWTKRTSHRWMLTFAFGLVHGFSFANVLRTLGLPATGLARSLLCFNLGVEIGQICIVAALWPLIWWLNRQPWDRRAKVGVSIAILLCGAVWFVERAFRLKLMPV